MSWLSVFVDSVAKFLKKVAPIATEFVIGQDYDIPVDDYIVTIKITDIKKK